MEPFKPSSLQKHEPDSDRIKSCQSHTCPGWILGRTRLRSGDCGPPALSTAWVSRGAAWDRVAVPAPGVKPLLAGGGGVRARCVSARLRQWEGARRRKSGETQPALPAGVAPVGLPEPALQRCAVFGRRGRLGRFGGEVAFVIGPGSSRHVRSEALESLWRRADL